MQNFEEYCLMRKEREKHALRDAPKIPPPFLRRLLGITTSNLMMQRPLFIDVNTIHQTVNYPGLVGRGITGVIDKAFEVDDTQGPVSWLNPNFAKSCGDAATSKLAFGAYAFLNDGAWYLNHQYTMNDVEHIFSEPTTDDAKMANMLMVVNGVPKYPEFYCLVRSWAIGSGWTTNPAWLKTASFRKIDKWFFDVERYWRSYNQYYAYLRGEVSSVTAIDPPWIAFNVANLTEKVTWAMNHGYLPAAQIELVDYSARWVIDQYGLSYLATFFEKQSTWPARWYWSNVPAVTVEEIVTKQLAMIPDTWDYKSGLFGLTPRLLQVGRVIIPEVVGPTGTPTEIDVDVYIGPGDVKDWINIPETEPEPPTCPAGQHWDGTKCVDDAVPPSGTLDQIAADAKAARELSQAVLDLLNKHLLP